MSDSYSARNFWQEFRLSDPGINSEEAYQVWYFGDSRDLAAELCELVLEGRKIATAALVWETELHPENAPIPNGYSVVTDFDGDPKCIIKTTEIQIIPFNEVDEQFAFDEGEGDQSLDYWRKVHWDYFSKRCAEMGKKPDLKMPVVCERFEVVYPKLKLS